MIYLTKIFELSMIYTGRVYIFDMGRRHIREEEIARPTTTTTTTSSSSSLPVVTAMVDMPCLIPFCYRLSLG
jgi:hypothetical protein